MEALLRNRLGTPTIHQQLVSTKPTTSNPILRTGSSLYLLKITTIFMQPAAILKARGSLLSRSLD